MKRPSSKARLRNRRVAAWSLHRRLGREGYGRLYGLEVRTQNQFIAPTKRLSYRSQGRAIQLSGRLDFRADPAGTLTQLNWLSDFKKGAVPFRVHVLMDDVTYIDAPSLLFLCSRIRWLKHLRGLVTGSYPREPRALKTLVDADFPGFLAGRAPRFDRTTRTLQLHDGLSESQLDPSVAADIKQFLSHLAPDLTGLEVDHIYMAAMECLENVRVHAYREDTRQLPGSWFAVGLYDSADESSTVAILDMGLGMRATVQRQLSPAYRAMEWISKPTADLIREATLGLRTETQERHRGKGLSTLREFTIKSDSGSISVYSGDGSVVWSKTDEGNTATIPAIDGTIVCLRLAKQAHALAERMSP